MPWNTPVLSTLLTVALEMPPSPKAESTLGGEGSLHPIHNTARCVLIPTNSWGRVRMILFIPRGPPGLLHEKSQKHDMLGIA